MQIGSPYALSFDCYGTLVDWESGISKFMEEACEAKGVRVDIAEIVKAREEIEFTMIQEEYRSYRQILSLSLKEAFYRFSIPYHDDDGEKLADSVSTWPLFADTRAALERLSERSKLVMISNVDNDIIRKTVLSIGVGFRLVVTAQDARAYKPSTKPFELALTKLRCKPKEILHVSSGFRYDIPPAHKLGLRTAWINRKHEKKPADLGPDFEFVGLTQLADSLEDSSTS
jgi:2-haloacid dehalogenase